jgi:outer membrane usher protein FimD/PapC
LFHTNSGFDRHGNGGFEAIRLDTTYVYSDPRSLRRYRAGDFISGSLPWTRPVRMGGAQINLDFSMRPDLITFPVPSISGSAAVPSTVDVLVNGSTVRSGSVAPGPFEVPQVPVISGAGTVTTTVTDALGRQVTTELPFYASPVLLAPSCRPIRPKSGLSDAIGERTAMIMGPLPARSPTVAASRRTSPWKAMPSILKAF